MSCVIIYVFFMHIMYKFFFLSCILFFFVCIIFCLFLFISCIIFFMHIMYSFLLVFLCISCIILFFSCISCIILLDFCLFSYDTNMGFIASEESFLLSHMGPPKNAIKSLILVLKQFCMQICLFFFNFELIQNKNRPGPNRPGPARPGLDASVTYLVTLFRSLFLSSCRRYEFLLSIAPRTTL